MQRYMVIETFQEGQLEEIYRRLAEKGRGLPEGLFFVESWLSADGLRCFQVMETANPSTFDAWMPFWADLASFEIVKLRDKPKV
ncbi:MAG: DUF3303 family protein [Pseudomonadota bacterium]